MDAATDLQARLDKLRKIRAEGVRVVEFRNGDTTRRVEFRDDAELVAAIRDLEGQLATLSGSRPVKTIYFTGGKGV